MSVPQIATLFQFPPNYASQTLKRLLGEDFSPHKISIEGTKAKVNVIQLTDFEKVLMKLAFTGNQQAQEIMLNLVGLSLHQLFSDAFGIRFELEERQAWIKARLDGKNVRKKFIAGVSNWLEMNAGTLSEKQIDYMFTNVSEEINLGIFDRKSKTLKEDWKVEHTRDGMLLEELYWIMEVEDLSLRLIQQQSYNPLDAVKEALNRLIIPKVDR